MKIGSLFSGYGGLDMGVQAVLGGETAWFVEFAEAPSKILAHHWPDVPNYHDVTAVDWSTVEPVDILTGGFPCQDVSLAGARAGLMEGTRSGLWSEYAKAIDVLRPSLVLIENVRGLLSARTMEEVNEADSDLEWESGSVGVPDGVDRPVLNAFGRVLGDLAELGYMGRWLGIRAADAGAPHGRFRVFILAYPAGREDTGASRDDAREGAWGLEPERGGLPDAPSQPGSTGHGDDVSARSSARRLDATAGTSSAEDADLAVGGERRLPAPGQAQGGRSRTDVGRRGGAPSAYSRCDGRCWNAETPLARGPREACSCNEIAWGPYELAIHRWEGVAGRSAPAPTQPDGRDGAHRLSAVFVEFMMGLPAGHVTDPAIGLTRNEQLKALGNGVVPQQAALALSLLMHEPHQARTEDTNA